MPLVWFSNCLTVMAFPSFPLPSTTPGSQCSTVSSSDTLPSPTSWSITVDTNAFVLLAIRNLSVTRAARPVAVSETPVVAYRRPSGPVDWATTATVPVLSMASTLRWSVLRCRDSVALAMGVARPSPTAASAATAVR